MDPLNYHEKFNLSLLGLTWCHVGIGAAPRVAKLPNLSRLKSARSPFYKDNSLSLLRRNKSGSPSGFTRIIHRTTMSQICVHDRFALGHQISHTDVESLYKKKEIYYTIRTNLSANHFYRVRMRRPTAVGLVNMQVLSHKSL